MLTKMSVLFITDLYNGVGENYMNYDTNTRCFAKERVTMLRGIASQML